MRQVESVLCKLAIAGLAAFPLFLVPSRAPAQQTKPHAESCTAPTWGYLRAIDDEYGTVNICSYAVDVWFMSKAEVVRHATAAPLAAFRTGLKLPAFNRKNGWIATTCPAGYKASLSVSKKNWEAILKSQYDCRKE